MQERLTSPAELISQQSIGADMILGVGTSRCLLFLLKVYITGGERKRDSPFRRKEQLTILLVLKRHNPLIVMTQQIFLSLFSLLLLSSFNECRPQTDTQSQSSGRQSMDTRLSSAVNSFGVDLFKALSIESSSRNVFFSPLSVSTCLSMVMRGAKSHTEDQMFTGLKLDQSFTAPQDVHSSFQSVSSLEYIMAHSHVLPPLPPVPRYTFISSDRSESCQVVSGESGPPE